MHCWSHLLIFVAALSAAVSAMAGKELYRADGVRILHDPFHPEMKEKYGAPGETDSEGFNPYADTVGPGIYGGRVQRDSDGNVVIGAQYQNHNPVPGSVYAGGGYTPTVRLLQANNLVALGEWLDKYPDLANEVTTGGASPLHMCGMSSRSQASASLLVGRGADIEARDTYGYTPLHRMASNNLALGAEALLSAGANVLAPTSRGETAMTIASQSRALDVIRVLQKYIRK